MLKHVIFLLQKLQLFCIRMMEHWSVVDFPLHISALSALWNIGSFKSGIREKAINVWEFLKFSFLLKSRISLGWLNCIEHDWHCFVIRWILHFRNTPVARKSLVLIFWIIRRVYVLSSLEEVWALEIDLIKPGSSSLASRLARKSGWSLSRSLQQTQVSLFHHWRYILKVIRRSRRVLLIHFVRDTSFFFRLSLKRLGSLREMPFLKSSIIWVKLSSYSSRRCVVMLHRLLTNKSLLRPVSAIRRWLFIWLDSGINPVTSWTRGAWFWRVVESFEY